MLLTFIRHGLTDGRPYVFRGRSDPALSAEGSLQLESAARNWDLPRVDHIYTSPRRHCETFAQQWAQTRNIPCTTLASLAEIDFGAWEEMTAQEARAQNPDCFAKMTADIQNWSAPDGESYRNFRARVLRALDEVASIDGDHVGVLTHGGVIRLVLYEILGMRPEYTPRIAIDYGSACRIWYPNRVLRQAQDERILHSMPLVLSFGSAYPEFGSRSS